MKISHRVFVMLVLAFVGMLTIVACSSAGSVAPTVSAPTPTTASQGQASATSAPPTTQATRTTQATSAATSASAATRTSTPSTSAPAGAITVATPATNEDAPGDPSKVYVSGIRVSPAQPVAGADYVAFYVTFVNNSGKSQAVKWYVKIWSPDNATQSFGETAKQINDIPTSTSVIASAANWRTNPIGCQQFTARVYWLNSGVNFGNPVEFTKPDGSAGVHQNFQVCEATKTP